MSLPVNWALLKNPVNWIIVVLMLVIAGFVVDIVLLPMIHPGKS